MRGGKNKHLSLGYTIVEVMIVLAVSGVMFLIAASFINGKQEKAAFTQGSNDLASQLQNVVADISDGHYSDVPIICSTATGSIGFPAGTGSQGENQDCVFLGKIVHFYDTGGGTERNNYEVFSIAAARSITGALPNAQVHAVPGLTTQATIYQNLYIKSMQVVDIGGSSHTDNYNIGFAQGLGTIDADSGVYQSGAQPISLVYDTIDATAVPHTASWSDAAEDIVVGNTVQPARSATICLTDGKRYAEIFIGGSTLAGDSNSNNGNQLSISAQQLGTTAC